MKDWGMLMWVTQLGLSVVMPLAGFTFAGLWLRQQFQLGSWVVIVAILVGIVLAVDGLIRTLKLLERMDKRKDKRGSTTSFNRHD